jgi:hypothetical protein
MRAELAALKEAGFTGYLIKPVRAGSLAAPVDERRLRSVLTERSGRSPGPIEIRQRAIRPGRRR